MAELLIKKYSNRRLYDTSASHYITLEDLRQMVKNGVEFVVKDAKTGEDLTRLTLTQIIFEQESKGYNVLPLEFLRQIICFYDDSLSSVLSSYLHQSMELFTKNQAEMRSIPNFMNIEALTQQNLKWFEEMMKAFGGFSKKE